MTGEALEERGQHRRETLLMIRVGIDLAGGRQLIDDLGQELGEQSRRGRGIDADFRRQRLDLFRAKCILNLRPGDRLVLPGADPRREDPAETALRELVHQPLHAAILRQHGAEHSGDRRFCATGCLCFPARPPRTESSNPIVFSFFAFQSH